MHTLSKIGALCIMFTILTPYAFSASVDEVSCTSYDVYSENSCDQCFLRTPPVNVGDSVANMTDVWNNEGNTAQVLYKESQDMPMMIPLGGASWSEEKVSDVVDFWKYSPALDEIYSEDEGGYVLQPGASVRWVESTIGSAYQLTSSPANAGTHVGLLVYDTQVHNIVDSIPEVDATMHRECVLYTSGETSTPTPPTRLPDTGPAHVLLACIALLLGAGLFFMTRRNA